MPQTLSASTTPSPIVRAAPYTSFPKQDAGSACHDGHGGDAGKALARGGRREPLSSERGAHKTVKARFRHWLPDKSP